MTAKLKRTSSFSYGKPYVNKDGKVHPFVLTENDLVILKTLARYPYLNLEWLAALTDRRFTGVRARVRLLKQFGYLKVADAQAATREARIKNIAVKRCLELATKGIKTLKPLGIDVAEKTTNILEHQAMASQIMASFELGAKNGLRVIHWPEIMDLPETPTELRDNPHPFTFKRVAYSYRGDPHTKDVRPDGAAFGIEYDDGQHLHQYFFPGIEADNGTEPIEAAQWGRTSIERKFCEYAEVAETRRYHTQLGFPHLYIPFVFNEASRMRTAMRLLHDLPLPVRVKKIFLFGVHSSNPNGDMLNVPFKRLTGNGLEDFSFAK